MKIIYGILIGIFLSISIAAIRPSKQQVILRLDAYNDSINSELNKYFIQGYRVVWGTSYAYSNNSSDRILIVLEK